MTSGRARGGRRGIALGLQHEHMVHLVHPVPEQTRHCSLLCMGCKNLSEKGVVSAAKSLGKCERQEGKWVGVRHLLQLPSCELPLFFHFPSTVPFQSFGDTMLKFAFAA